MARVVRVKVPPVTTEVLEKGKVRLPKIESELASLASRSHQILGYSFLNKAVKTDRTLARALRKLHIRPYTDASVKEYKDAKQKEVQSKNKYARVTWEAYNLVGYEKPVPEFVLNKALEIKEEVPDVEFMIEELTIHPDPFLVAVLGKERYHVEVWDEPKFEAKVLEGIVFDVKKDNDDEEEDT